MRARSIFVVIAVLGWFGGLPSAHGAAQLDFRESRLAHVCKGGDQEGTVCCLPDPQCGTGTCVVNATGKVSGTLTIVVDDDVSQLTGATIAGRHLKALTVIFETKGKTGIVVAQTFQRLEGATLDEFLTGLEQGTPDEFGLSIDENLLKLTTDTTGTGVPLDVTWLIYRTLDPETLVRMRTNAGLQPNGPELLVVQPSKLKLQRYTNETTTGFGSFLRAKVNTYFVAPKGPPCP
jgi:hypothetical protein